MKPAQIPSSAADSDFLLKGGLAKWTNGVNRFRVLRTHYTADPDKATKAWYAKTRPGYSKTGWDQEFEITFTSYEGKGVYRSQFGNTPVAEGGHLVRSLDFDPDRPIYRIWDFGYHHPACLFIRETQSHHHVVFDELMGTDIFLQEFVPQVLEMTERYKGKYSYIKDFCDPAGKQPKSTGKSDLEILREFDIRPTWAQFEIKDTINYVRNSLTTTMADGLPVLLVDADNCPILIDGLSGGYRYPPGKEGKADKELPLDDGYYEHLQDCLRYYHGHRLRLKARRRDANEVPADIKARIAASKFESEQHGQGKDEDRRSHLIDPRDRYPGQGRFTDPGRDKAGVHPDRSRSDKVVGGVRRRQIIVRDNYDGPVYSQLER